MTLQHKPLLRMRPGGLARADRTPRGLAREDFFDDAETGRDLDDVG